jgi:hypothetical protein
MVQEISKAQASEYEHVVLVDRSGSMGEPSKRIPGKTRWAEAQEHISGLCNYLHDVDENGIDIILFSGTVTSYDGVKTTDDVKKIFSEVQPKGSTNLADAIREANKKRTANQVAAISFTSSRTACLIRKLLPRQRLPNASKR